jgi:serine/threonine-protein kinase
VEETPFGRYRLRELLGRGGMGEVWRAHDVATDRIVAIKVLPAHLSGNEMFQQRFRREAHAATRLNTPHVIPIYDYGEIDGRLYVSMRLIDGHDLQEVLAQGPLTPARAVRIVEQIAKALHAAHKIGLVHRDVKPSNILVDEDDFAYLIDFGIARALEDARLTSTGYTVGTVHYIAPERLGDNPTDDARADIYALTCVLYECLTARPPFAGSSMGSLVASHLNSPPPQPSTSQPNVPPQLDKVIERGMAKDPDQRYATTVELADAAHDAIAVPMQFSDPGVPAIQHADWTDQSPTQLAPTGPPPPPARHEKRARELSRPTKIALIGGAVAIVAVIAAAVGIPAIVGHRPSGSSPTSSEQTHSAQTVLPFAGLNLPGGVAVDSAGNVYVADWGNHRVMKLPPGSLSQEVLPFSGLNNPTGVAVDPAGTLYVADFGNHRVVKLPAGSSSQEVLPFTGLDQPEIVAVDPKGSLYVTDRVNNRVVKLAAGADTSEVLAFPGLNEPYGVAVDPEGTLYVTDAGNKRVVKLAAGADALEVLPFTGLTNPSGVAVDSAGNVYVTDWGGEQVVKLPAAASSQEVLPFTGLNAPSCVAVDSAGNVYVTDDPNRVLKLPAR